MKKKRDGNRATSIRDETPEDGLWRNVIAQAIADATLQLPDHRSIARHQTEVIRGQARRWIKLQTDDFKLVCELAGLEASRVRQFAMTKIRESIERENARTAELLTSAMPGVASNFLQRPPDRHASDPREAPEIGFSTQDENTTLNESLSAADSSDMAAAEVKL